MKRGVPYGNDPISKLKCLFEAIDKNRPDMIQSLINEGVDVNGNNEHQHHITPLIRAMKNGHMDSIRTLLKAGANVHGVDENANTALHYAANFGNKDSIGVLVNAGANVNSINTKGATPLMAAAQFVKEDNEALEILIKSGAQIERNDNDGNTALHYAAHGENVKATEGLLGLGANINAKNKVGITPLMVAVAEFEIGYNSDVIKSLIRKGADVYAKSSAGKTVLDQAIEKLMPNTIFHLLALEDAEGQNRFFKFEDQPRPHKVWLKALQLQRQQELKDNALYYLVCSLLKDGKTKEDAEKSLESFKTHDVGFFGVKTQIEKNEKFFNGMKILSDLNDDLKGEVFKFSNPGPLTYDRYEDDKAKRLGKMMSSFNLK